VQKKGNAFMGMNSDSSHADSLTIVVPCFNEAGNLPRLFGAINEVISSQKGDIKFIIVENGSRDGSRRILQNQKENEDFKILYLDENYGYGAGILAGVQESQTFWTGWIHADLQTPLETISTAYRLVRQKNQPVKGVRKGRSLSDRVFTFGMSIICSILFGTRLSDINGQPTIYPTTFLRAAPKPPKDFSLDLYFYIQARKAGFTLERLSAKMSPRIEGQSSWNLGLRSRVKMIKRTLQFAFQLRKTL